MSRFPPIPAADLTAEQKDKYDSILELADKMHAGKNFTYKRPSDSALIGPFAPLMYTPKAVGMSFLQLGDALGQMPGFPGSARETTILVTGAHFQSAYELYAHSRIAESTGVLSKAQVESLVQGKLPEDASEDVSVAYEVTKALCAGGPLKESVWEKATGRFGREGAAALMHYVAAYAYACVLMNAADVPVPDE